MTKISNNDLQKIVLNCIGKPKVAFICVHNACRSQIAEALGKLFASDVFVSFSAGTKVTSQINQDAVRLMKEIYDIDMEASQHNKLISDIPSPDIVILMGCNAKCPNLNSQYTENWELDDPTGKSDVEFKKTIKLIENNIHKLIDKLS
ncbi:MAG: arsenate reductase ArsC [Bacilli bacterium]